MSKNSTDQLFVSVSLLSTVKIVKKEEKDYSSKHVFHFMSSQLIHPEYTITGGYIGTHKHSFQSPFLDHYTTEATGKFSVLVCINEAMAQLGLTLCVN